jgi:hypothetical protein
MKIKMLTSIASPDWSYGHGEIVEVEEKQAVAWIKSEIAEAVKDVEIETATTKTPETASKKPVTKKRTTKK